MDKEKPRVIKLDYPIQKKTDGGGTVEITEITIQRLKVKHLKMLPAGAMEDFKSGKMELGTVIPLMAAATGLSTDDFDEMDTEDLGKLSEVFEQSMGEQKSQKTGTK